MTEYMEFAAKCRGARQDVSLEGVPEGIANCAWDPTIWSYYYNSRLQTPGVNSHTDATLCALRTLAARSVYDFIERKEVAQVVRSATSSAVETLRIASPDSSFQRVDAVVPIPPTAPRPRYTKTTVHVVNMDSLELARQATKLHTGSNVACLNMANQYRAGGSWRTGRLAQEEQLFYRTTLSHSLERAGYPLGDYSAVFTRGVSVVREGIEKGLQYYTEKDVWQTNFVTAAAFDMRQQVDQTLPQKVFEKERIVKTRVKIEALVSLCVSEGMDILVLSALGCGVFRNPPDFVAAIFRAVIEQYAGYFSHIYFAIKGEPRTPNLYYFAETLLGVTTGVQPTQNISKETVPPRDYPCRGTLCQSVAFSTVDGSSQKPVCPKGSACRVRNPVHYRNYIHPPLCTDPECKGSSNNHHNDLFTHRKVCKLECEYAFMGSPDAQHHCTMFYHKQNCPKGGMCQELANPEHYSAYTHPARCKDGPGCTKKSDPEHAMCWTHMFAPLCKDGIFCLRFGDHKHMEAFSHPFKPPCPEMFLLADKSGQCGCKGDGKHSHFCEEGPFCTKLSDASHIKDYIHVGKECKMGAICNDKSEAHLLAYWHKNNGGSLSGPLSEITSPSDLYALKYHALNYIIPIAQDIPDYDENTLRLICACGQMSHDQLPAYTFYRNWALSTRPTVLMRTPNEVYVYAALGNMYSLQTLLTDISRGCAFLNFMLANKVNHNDCRCIVHAIKKHIPRALSVLNARKAELGAYHSSYFEQLLNNVAAMETFPSDTECMAHLETLKSAGTDVLLTKLGEAIGVLIEKKLEAPELAAQAAAGTLDKIEGCLGQVPCAAGDTAAVAVLERQAMYHQAAFTLQAPIAALPAEARLKVCEYATHPAHERWAELMAMTLVKEYPNPKEFMAELNNNSGRYPAVYFPGMISLTSAVSIVALPSALPLSFSSSKTAQLCKTAKDHKELTSIVITDAKESDPFCAGATFSLSASTNASAPVKCPVFIPSGGSKVFLCFGVSYSVFTVLLNDAKNDARVNISINGNNACISYNEAMRNGNPKFNERARNNKSYIFYMVEITPRAITLKHYVPSAVLNQETLTLESLGSDLFGTLHYISVIMHTSSSGPNAGSIYGMRCCGEDMSLKMHHFKKVERNEDGELEPSARLRYCTKPFNCPVAGNNSHPDHVRHVMNFRHVCPFGVDCKEFGDPDHCRMYAHLEKPVCTKLDDSLYNPEHRLMYHHKMYHDFLLPCKNGSKCPSRNDPSHIVAYYHSDYINSIKNVKKFIKK